MKTIKINEIKLSPISLVDDVCKTYFWNNKVIRTINKDYRNHVISMFECGLMEDLYRKKFIPQTTISDNILEGWEGILLEQEKVDLIYPQELSFEMLKDAAKFILSFTETCHKYGYYIKDCHLHNLGFKDGNFVFFDIGSIQKNTNDFFRFSYVEFILQYILPLKLYSKGFVNKVYNMIALYSSNVSAVSEYCKDVNVFFRLMPLNILTPFLNLYFKFKNIHSVPDRKIEEHKYASLIQFLKKPYFRFLTEVNCHHLKRKIDNISFPKRQISQWGDYYTEPIIGIENIKSTPRFDKLVNMIEGLKDVRTVCDIGSNAGIFVFNLFKKNNRIEKAWCIEPDKIAINKLYQLNRDFFHYPIIPICNDPFIPRLIWFHNKLFERIKTDLVSCLALTHHLILTQNLSMDYVLRTICQYTKKYLLIEFMPLGLWDSKSAQLLPQWYNKGWFEGELSKYFIVKTSYQTEENRIFYLCEKVEYKE
jgi:hypothetical protein